MPDPVRILFTIPNFITAGSGRVMLNILERLDPALYAPAVCVQRMGGRLDVEVKSLGIPFFEMPFTVPVQPYATLPLRSLQQAQAFRKFGFEIWHSFHYADDYTEPLIARLSGAKAWVYTKKSMSWGSRAWFLRSLMASAIIADNSEMPAKFFHHALLRNKVSLIHHGIPLDVFRPGAPPRGLRQSFTLAPSEISIGCVAQLVTVKGHPISIEALSQLNGVHLFLAGSTTDSEYRAHLQVLASKFGVADRVHFLGAVNDIPGFLSEIDIFALPTITRGEGCPVALLEAMACAKACIATDIPGSRDLIISGECGLLVPPEDPAALANAIQVLIDSPDLRQKFGQAARRRVEQHFSIEREVQDHEALYEAIIKDRRSRP